MRQKRLYEFRDGTVSWIRYVRRWFVAVSVGLVLAGCGAPNIEEDPKIKALTNRLNEIETIRLEEQSYSEPITVDEATVEVVEQITVYIKKKQ